MAIQQKPDEKVFASNAQPREVSPFPDIERGWGFTFEQTGGIPTMEHFNALFKRIDEQSLYLFQQGVAPWSATMTYPQNAFTQHNGLLYVALRENQNQPPNAASSVYWKKFGLQPEDIPPASLTDAGKVQLSSAVNSDDETKAATSKAIKTAYDLADSKVGKTGDENIAGRKSFTARNYFKGNIEVADGTSYADRGSKIIHGANDNDAWLEYRSRNNVKGTLRIHANSTVTFERERSGVRNELYHAGNTPDAALNRKGFVQLSNDTDSDDETKAATPKAVKAAAKKGLPVGAVVAFPKTVRNPQGFLLCDGSNFNQQTYPDLYRTLGNSTKLPKLNRSDVGMMAWFPSDQIPDGWLWCTWDDGTQNKGIPRDSYPELYDFLIREGKYGTFQKNGKTYANLPNPEDRFIRNAGNGLRVGDKQEDEIKAHIHMTPLGGVQHWAGHYGFATSQPIARVHDINDYEDSTRRELTSSTGGSETRPKSIIFKLCIKAKNSFDDVQFWIKAFGEVTNAGTLDAGRLAQDIQNKADRTHTHTTSQITDFAQGVAGQFIYQKTGNFEIRKFPDGTMIQTYYYDVNDLSNFVEMTFTWAQAFREKPLMWGDITMGVTNATDKGINILTKSTNARVYYQLFEHWNGNQGNCRIQFFAIGRWL